MNDNQVMHAMVLDDTYHTERVLARGEGGVTELVTIDGAGPFVRKKIPSALARRRVWSELAECSSTRLPHIEATYELPDQFVVIYDFVPGKSLESHVRKNGPLAPLKAVSIAQQVCEAADELHRHGIIHRDISPSNVVLAADGAHLIDLGIARMRVDGAPHDTTSLGTWGYASPEQYGFAQTDARSDVYSIGSVLGYLVTGIRPGDDGYDEALQAGELPAALCAIMAKARAFEPSARYQSAAEMAEALGSGTDGSLGNTAASAGRESEQGSRTEDARTVNAAARAYKPDSGKISVENGWHAVRDTRARRRRKKVLACICSIAVVGAGAIGAGLGLFGGGPGSPSATSAGKVSSQSAGSSAEPGIGTSSPSKEDDAIAAGKKAAATQPSATETPALELLESGWSCSESGYISFGASIKTRAPTRRSSTPPSVLPATTKRARCCSPTSTYFPSSSPVKPSPLPISTATGPHRTT